MVGYLCVVLTSYLVYRASELIAQDKLSAFVAALVAAAMMSVLAPALMTELLCVPLLSAALLLLCSGHGSPRRAFLAGLLIGMAAMIRSNLAVLGFAVGILVIARPPLVPPARLVTRGFAYAAGVLLIVAITVIPYLVSGRLPLWFDTVIRAGAEFSAHHRSFDNLRRLVQIAFRHPLGRNDETCGVVARRAAVDRRPGRTPVLRRTLARRSPSDNAMPSSPPPCSWPVRRWRWQ